MSVRYRRMQPHVVADWQRLHYCANYLTQGLAEWRQVRRRSLMGRLLWRFDAIGGYPFRQGYCLRDAFAQYFGANHPALAGLTRSMAFADVAAWCRRHNIRFLHGEWEVVIIAGEPVVWFLAPLGSEVAGHAVFCREPQRVIQSGREIVAVALLERGVLGVGR